jgi:hypothetical protein
VPRANRIAVLMELLLGLNPDVDPYPDMDMDPEL